MQLILKLILGILIGIIFGLFAPEALIQILLTMKALISQLIGFTIPLLVLFFVTSGIANLPKNSGKILSKTIGFSYLSTTGAGALAYLIAGLILPSMLYDVGGIDDIERTLTPFMTLKIPPVMGVMTALTLAFILGLGITATNSKYLRRLSDEGRNIIELFLAKIMVPALPFYIAGVFADMTVKGTVFSTLKTFSFVLVLIVILHWLWLSFQFISIGVLLGRSPVTLFKNMLPAYITALGTMSSAASLPVTLRQTELNGVRKPIANFVVPLCANIHMSGSAISITTVCVAVMLVTGNSVVPSFIEALPFIVMLGVTMVAAPGAPGGAVMAAVGLLGSMMGFTEAMIGLQIALHLAQDGFGTACNITGDGALALLIDDLAEENQFEETASNQTQSIS